MDEKVEITEEELREALAKVVEKFEELGVTCKLGVMCKSGVYFGEEVTALPKKEKETEETINEIAKEVFESLKEKK